MCSDSLPAEILVPRLDDASGAGGAPELSIVIPTHERVEQLGHCLAALRALDFDHDRFEVVIVDDGGKSDLVPLARSFAEQVPLVLVRQPKAGPARARNAGIRLARAPVVVFTDDDCRPEPGWLAAIASCAQENPGCAVGGKTVNGLPENRYSVASQELVHYLYTAFNRDPNYALFMTSNNLAFPRDPLLKLSGFDHRFSLPAAEDWELCDRWREAGHRIVFEPRAVVTHFHTMGLRGFLSQHFAYGRGAAVFRRVKQERGPSAAYPPRHGFYRQMLRHPFTHHRPRTAFVVSVLFAVAQVTTQLGFWWQRAQPTPEQRPGGERA